MDLSNRTTTAEIKIKKIQDDRKETSQKQQKMEESLRYEHNTEVWDELKRNNERIIRAPKNQGG